MVKQGNVVKINFDPSVGSEQAGYRPAVIISNNFVISKTNIITIYIFVEQLPQDKLEEISNTIISMIEPSK